MRKRGECDSFGDAEAAPFPEDPFGGIPTMLNVSDGSRRHTPVTTSIQSGNYDQMHQHHLV